MLSWGGGPRRGHPLLGSALPAPLPGLAAARRGAHGQVGRGMTRASRASHVLGGDHGGEGQGDGGDPGAVQHHRAPPGAPPSGHQGLRGRDQRYAPLPRPATAPQSLRPSPPSIQEPTWRRGQCQAGLGRRILSGACCPGPARGPSPSTAISQITHLNNY